MFSNCVFGERAQGWPTCFCLPGRTWPRSFLGHPPGLLGMRRWEEGGPHLISLHQVFVLCCVALASRVLCMESRTLSWTECPSTLNKDQISGAGLGLQGQTAVIMNRYREPTALTDSLLPAPRPVAAWSEAELVVLGRRNGPHVHPAWARSRAVAGFRHGWEVPYLPW